MIKAILKDGVIVPTEPLPKEWKEGWELVVDESPDRELSPEESEQWAKEMEALCADADPAEDDRLMEFLTAMKRAQKEAMRKVMERMRDYP